MSSSEQNSLNGRVIGSQKQRGKETKRSQLRYQVGIILKGPTKYSISAMKSLILLPEPIWQGPSAECWESVSITNSKTAGSEVSNYWGEAFEGDEETGETLEYC